MKRKKKVTHENAIVNFHSENHSPGTREWKLLIALYKEEVFNSLDSVVLTDEHKLLCKGV